MTKVFFHPDGTPSPIPTSKEQDWAPPTAEEVREYLKAHGLTGSAASRMVKVDPRTFRRYTSHTKALNVPYCVWYTLRSKVVASGEKP